MNHAERMEVELAGRIIDGAMGDLDQIKRFWPPSKRGSNAQRQLEYLESRLSAARQAVEDALKVGDA